jgi:hypothetical protein
MILVVAIQVNHAQAKELIWRDTRKLSLDQYWVRIEDPWVIGMQGWPDIIMLTEALKHKGNNHIL